MTASVVPPTGQANTPDQLTIRVTSTRTSTATAMATAQANAYIETRAAREKEVATQQLDSIDSRIATLSKQLTDLNEARGGLPRGSGDAAAADGQIAALTDRINKLSQSRVPIAESQSASDGDARLVSVSAASASTTSATSRAGALALLAAVGLALGLGGAVLIGRLLPPVIESPDDASDIFGGPILAVLPRRRGREREPLVLHERATARARALHAAAAMIESSGDVPSRLLVAGVDSSVVPPLIGVNLAISLARHGHKVAIIGTHESHLPALAALGVTATVGYGDLVQKALAGDITVDVEDCVFEAEGVEAVWVLPPGDRRSTAPPRAVDQIFRVLEADGAGVDVCVVLTPPDFDDPHTPVLARLTGAAVWVVDRGATRADHARAMADRLVQAGAPAAGIVLIGT
jgi:Mrp family chromosome partitioning ATPase/prefoldin subunit 5